MMRFALGKLMLLLAVLLMPLGMATAPASTRDAPATAMPMSHCSDNQPGHAPKSGVAECTMACSAALPAVDVGGGSPLTIVCVPVRPAVAQRLHGLHPETATPPPKRA